MKQGRSKWHGPTFRIELDAASGKLVIHLFLSSCRPSLRRPADCLSQAMSFWYVVLAAKLVLVVFALLRESGEDARFSEDKLRFRS